MKISVKTDIDIPKHIRQVNDPNFWVFTATEWHRLYAPFVPFQEGNLTDQVIITPKQIEHTVPYANRQYEGNFNHSGNRNPLATRKWDQAAEPTQKPKLIRAMQGYVDSGKLNLDK